MLPVSNARGRLPTLAVPLVGLVGLVGLVAVACVPALLARTGRSTPWAVAVGSLGLVLVAFGLVLTVLTLNRLASALYVSPLLIVGVVCVGIALHSRLPPSTGGTSRSA